MIRRLAELVMRNLNQFPSENSASEVHIPLTIVTGQPKVDYNNLTADYGSYAEVFEDDG